MTYTPGQGINPLNSGYDFRDHGQYDNQAYDNYGYGNHFAQTITPFRAYVQKNLTGYGYPPPGMGFGEYQDRIDSLANRFTNHAATSAVTGSASFATSLALMYPNILGLIAPDAGSGLLGRAFSAAGSAGNFVFGGGALNTGAGLFGDWAGSSIGNSISGALTSGLNSIGNAVSPGWHVGSIISKGISNLAVQYGTEGMAKAATGILSGTSSMTNMGSALGWLGKGTMGLAGSISGFMLTDYAIKKVLGATINAGLPFGSTGIDAKEEEVADIFQGLSDKIMGGGSGYKNQAFAEDLAERIRDKAIAQNTGGIFPFGKGSLPFGDNWAGRFFQGDSVKSSMDVMTAQYGLMAQSGLIGKSNSADEFIKKADAMYAAIEKLGSALGQTTSKAMETARALKSQGLRNPGEIGAAGDSIGLSSAMTGYSSNQVMALTGEATEAFRGTVFGANMGFTMANDVMRRGSLASNIVGADSWDKTLYTMRGEASTNVTMTKVTAKLFNSSEIKDMMVASMFERTDNGFRFTGKINKELLDEVAAGGTNRLTDPDMTAILSEEFRNKNATVKRAAERDMNNYSSSLTASKSRGLLGGAFRMRGFGNDQQGYETQLREMGVPPLEAFNMSKVMSADISTQEMYYDYYNRKSSQLDVIDRRNTDGYATGLSRLLFDSHRLTGSWTPSITAGASAVFGAGIGAGIGSAVGPLGTAVGAAVGAGVGLLAGAAQGTAYYDRVADNAGFGGGGMLQSTAGFGIDTTHKAASIIGAGAGMYAIGSGVKAGAELGIFGYTSGSVGLANSAKMTLKGASAGLMKAGYAVATGIASGYIADAGIDRLSEYMKWKEEGKSWKGSAGIIAGGAKTATGASIAAGALWATNAVGAWALGGATLISAPLVTAGIVIGGTVALGKHIYDNYIGSDETGEQRRLLKQQMQAAMGMTELKYKDERLYNNLLDKARSLSKTDDNILGERLSLQGGLDPREELAAKQAADRITGGIVSGDSIQDQLELRGTATDKYLPWNWGSWGGAKGDLGNVVRGNFADFMDNLSTNRYSTASDGFRNIDSKSDVIRDLKSMRATYKYLDKTGKEQFLQYIESKGGDKINIVGKKGNKLYGLVDFIQRSEGDSYENIKDSIDTDLKLINSKLFAKNPNFVNASNVALVAAAIDLSQETEFSSLSGQTKWDSVRQRMVDKGIASEDTARRIASGLNRARENKDLNLVGNLAAGLVGAVETSVLKSQTENYLSRKGRLLGDKRELIGRYMHSLLGGKLEAADSSELVEMQNRGFSSIKDEATRSFMRNSTSAGRILSSFGDNMATSDELISRIQSDKSLDGAAKERILAQIKSRYDFGNIIRPENMDKLKESIQKDLFISSSTERSKMTSDNLLELNNEKLGNLAVTMQNLTSAILADKGAKITLVNPDGTEIPESKSVDKS